MTPLQLQSAGHRLYGRKHWKKKLADAVGVDVSTIHRIAKREQVPGLVEVAVKGLLEHKQRQDVLDKAARALLPKGYKKRHRAPRKKPAKKPPAPLAEILGPPEDVIP